jgi:hypothetical protein
MNRTRTANILIGVTAVLLVATGALHLGAYPGSIAPLAASAPDDVRHLLPAVWLAVGIDLVVMGLIVAAIGYENSTGSRLALAAVALCPLGGVVMHLMFFGFIQPTALLLLDGVLALACAIVREPRRRRSTTGA